MLLRAVNSFDRLVRSLSFICLTLLVAGQHRNAARKKSLQKYPDVSVELPNGNRNWRELGIARCEKKWEWDLSFRREWDGNWNEVIKLEGFGTKHLFPHISNLQRLSSLTGEAFSVTRVERKYILECVI